MAFVITQNCCNDASCVPVCPVDCIRSEPTSSMLFIDPAACVDCGACLAECPVGAIYYEDDLPAGQQVFRGINAGFFAQNPLRVRNEPAEVSHAGVEPGALRVAIVGSGPAACYAAAELTRIDGVEVSVFERLPTPFGLIRSGVAPDHQRTKGVVSVFEPALGSPGTRCYFNVAVGKDISHDDLLAHHNAVIYAVGASGGRTLGIPGEELPGVRAAADFVAWYNGHPDHADNAVDLSGPRVVVVGNGNVALDIARVLVSDVEALARTDIADHALQALGQSGVREVVLVGRRGAADAAFSIAEFLALGGLPGVDVVVEGELGTRPDDDFERALKYDTALDLRDHVPTPGNKRIVFRFGVAPAEVMGDDGVRGLRVVPTGTDGAGAVIETANVLCSIGYRGAAVPDLPFDAVNAVVPNVAGRVVDDGAPVPGVYVAGWIKRGPRGVIGTNRTCARETVAALLEDFRSGRLGTATGVADGVDELLAQRGIRPVGWADWQRIDAAELRRGTAQSRARSKLVSVDELLDIAGV